jgi:hypothetical protein
MDHTVIALDLSDSPCASSGSALLDALDRYQDPLIVAVSSFQGVDGWISAALEPVRASGGGRAFDGAAIIERLRAEHRELAGALGAPAAAQEAACLRIDRLLGGLWALIAPDAQRIGPSSSGASSRRIRALGAGDRLAATCVALALIALGRPAAIYEDLGDRSSARIREALGSLPGAVVPSLQAAYPIAEALGCDGPATVLPGTSRGCAFGAAGAFRRGPELAARATEFVARASELVARSPGVA